jgi:hypothetical protein
MRSVPLREAYSVAEAYSKRLDAIARDQKKSDPRFDFNVLVLHEEGTTFFFRNAFVVRWESWHIVLPEHHDIHVYPDDEVKMILQMREVPEVEEIKNLVELGVDPSAFKFDHSTMKRTAP